MDMGEQTEEETGKEVVVEFSVLGSMLRSKDPSGTGWCGGSGTGIVLGYVACVKST